MSSHGLDCDETMRLLMDYLKQEMTAATAQEVRRHLEACRECDDHAQFEQNFLKLLEERLGRDTCPEKLRARLAEVLGEDSPQA